MKQNIINKNKTRPKLLEPDIPQSYNILKNNKKILGPTYIKVISTKLAIA